MRSYFPTFFPFFVVIVLVLTRRPINLLRRRGAVSPETAQRVDDLSAGDRRRFEQWKAQGIIREAEPGHFYYDAAAERARARTRVPWLVALGVALLAIALWLYLRQPPVRPLP